MSIGFNSGGKHKTKEGGKPTRAHTSWKNLMKHCGSDENDCTVCEEWLDFQNFAEWYDSHNTYRDDYRLTKGLLVNSNIYSPDTCHLLPRAFVDLRLDNLPKLEGYLPTRSGKYIARIAVEGKTIQLGSFDSPSEAFEAYALAKERQVMAVVREYRDIIDSDVYNALINWKFPV